MSGRCYYCELLGAFSGWCLCYFFFTSGNGSLPGVLPWLGSYLSRICFAQGGHIYPREFIDSQLLLCS